MQICMITFELARATRNLSHVRRECPATVSHLSRTMKALPDSKSRKRDLASRARSLDQSMEISLVFFPFERGAVG